jgi:hypothetical protein
MLQDSMTFVLTKVARLLSLPLNVDNAMLNPDHFQLNQHGPSVTAWAFVRGCLRAFVVSRPALR